MKQGLSKARKLAAEASAALEELEFPENYSVAERLLKEAVSIGASLPLCREVLDHGENLASLLQERDRIVEAIDVAELALGRVDTSDRAQVAMAADLSFLLAKIEWQDGQLEAAEQRMKAAIESKIVPEGQSAWSKQSMLRSHEELLGLLGRPNSKIATLLGRLDGHRKEPLGDPMGYHATLEQAAVAYIQEADYAQALDIIEEAQNLLEMPWDKSRIRDQWDAMTDTIRRRLNR